jgi:hypothetical protein
MPIRTRSVYKGNMNRLDGPVKIYAYYSEFVNKICYQIYSNIYKAVLYRAFKKSKIDTRLHENRTLYLYAVEPRNLAVLLAFYCRDVYIAALRQRCDVVMVWRIFLLEPQRKF